MITRNSPSPSPERRASHRVQLLVLGLPQTPRTHQEPPDHQDRLGAVKHQEKQAPKPSLDLHSVGPNSSTLATLANDEFFNVEAQTIH